MSPGIRLAVGLVSALAILPASPFVQGAEAQVRDPVRLSGQASAVSEFYAGRGVDRWPGAAWRLNLSPRASLFGEVNVGFDILLSSTQSEFRQNINQVGISPSWSWGTVHLGDFSRDYSRLLLQGVRVRGAGLELRGRGMAFELQGGRAQRTVTASELAGGTTAFQRTLVAARALVGAASGSHLDLSLLSGRDNPGRVDNVIVVPDTLLLDTIPIDLRPPTDSRPQENHAVALGGQVALGGRTLVLRGQLAGSLLTRDREASLARSEVDELAIPGGIYGTVERFHDIRLSTGFDHAWEVEGTVNAGPGRFRATVDHVGPGFGSMGLPSFTPDRRSYRLDAATRHRDGRLALQGQFRNQANNLSGQLRNTVDRRAVGGSVMFRILDPVQLTLTGIHSDTRSDAPADSAQLNQQAMALTGNVGVQRELAGRPAVYTVGYGFQRARDASPGAPVPVVTTHSVNGSVQLSLTPTFRVAPSISGVTTSGTGFEGQRNLFLGMRGDGRFLDGDLRRGGNLARTVSQGQQILNSQFQASYPLGWATELRLQARHNRHAAFGNRPAFEESFLTLSLDRSF